MEKILILLISSFALLACQRNLIYTHFVNLNKCEWHMDSACLYMIPGIDSTNNYDAVLHIRHSSNYPYQNMWLEVSYFQDDSITKLDTIEIYLANNRGKWLGIKKNSIIEMPVMLRSHDHLSAINKIEIKQLMRDTILREVYDVGLNIKVSK